MEKKWVMSLSVTTDWTDVCIQGDGDRTAAIIHPVPAENDGFIGHLSTSSAFEEDIVSQGAIGARVCVCVSECVLQLLNNNQLCFWLKVPHP